MNTIFLNNLGDLSEIQRASFFRFLYLGISEELDNFINPIECKLFFPTRTRKKRFLCELFYYPEEQQFIGPRLSLELAIRSEGTYALELYVQGYYSYSFNFKYDQLPDQLKKQKIEKSKKTKLQTNKVTSLIHVNPLIFFGEIPLMTEEGSFLVNGCERVVITQIIRSPGVYFQKEYQSNNRAIYTATIISNKGLWSRIILDHFIYDEKKKKIQKEAENNISPKSWQRIYLSLNEYKKKNKEGRGIEEKNDDSTFVYLPEILHYFGLSFTEIWDQLKYPFFFTNQQLGAYSKKRKRKKKHISHPFISKLANDFFHPQTGGLSIGEIGRYRLNKQLGLNLPEDITFVTPLDFIEILNGLLDLKYYDRLSDDIDHLKNKQIRPVGDLLQNQFRVGLTRIKPILGGNGGKAKSSQLKRDLKTTNEFFSNAIREQIPRTFFDTKPITIAFKEFFMSSQLAQYMDQTNPLAEVTQKRRITVFGPNGLQRDHVSIVIRDLHPSQYGRLCPVETPEGQNAGLVSSLSLSSRFSPYGWLEAPYFFAQEKHIKKALKAIYLNPDQETMVKIAFCDFALSTNQEILPEYVSIKKNYSFSLEKNSEDFFVTPSPLNLISLATSLVPFLEHDDANRALMGANMQRQAVPLIFPQKPIVGTGLEIHSILDSQMVLKAYHEGKVKYVTGAWVEIEDLNNQRIHYKLRKYQRSNQSTNVNQRPIVWEGEIVFSNQILADGASTLDGELAIGRNLTIAYMPWEGYNYEDAIVISEKVVIEDCLTSVHLEEYETTIDYLSSGLEMITREIPTLTPFVKRHLDEKGVVKIGSYVKGNDILVGKAILTSQAEAAFTPFLKFFKTLGERGEKKKERMKEVLRRPNVPVQTFRDNSLRVPIDMEGRVIDVRLFSTDGEETNLNDILNIGKVPSNALKYSQILKITVAQIRKIQIGDKLAGRHGNKGIISKILPRQDMPCLPNGQTVDILFNPLGVPSRMNVGQIYECLLGFAGEYLQKRFKVSPFDEMYGKEASRVLINQKLKQSSLLTQFEWLYDPLSPGKIFLKDGRTGEFFDNSIIVGKAYILKLIHLVEDKIHARSTGPYAMITEQPLGGKAQNGGQRFGEMEVWALEAFGCSQTLQELLTIKSDDIDGRNDMFESLVFRKKWWPSQTPNPSLPEGFFLILRELNALGLDISVKRIQPFHNSFSPNSKAILSEERDFFKEIEARLKLRTLKTRRKAEKLALLDSLTDEAKKLFSELLKREYKEIIKRYEEIVKENSDYFKTRELENN